MKKYNLYVFAFFIAVLSGCSKSYLDVNTNPNSPTSTPLNLVLPNALTVSVSGQVTDFTYLEGWMGYWAPSGSYATGTTDVASYYQTSSTYAPVWDKYYSNLEDYDYVETSAKAEGNLFYVGAAKVMKVYMYQQLVDMFNNVPYTGALKATGNIQPKYDKGQAVYDAISAQLDSAVIDFKALKPAGDYSTSDILFKGDNTQWIAFANTLKLRILMRQTQVSSRQSVITAGIAKINSNGGGFLTEDASVNPGYAANADQQNPVYGYFYTVTNQPTSGGRADFWRANKYMLDYCRNYHDPRYKYFYQVVAGTDTAYVGNVLGLTTNFSTSSSSGAAGSGIAKSVGQSAVLITAAESYFLQAEAILRGYLSGTLTTTYTAGVHASFNYLGAPSDSADKILSLPGNKNSNLAACITTQDKLNCIIRQKWMAMNGTTPFEAWSDYRRLGLPTNPSIPVSISPYKVSNNIPYRLLYPTSEYLTNAAAVAAEGSINPQTSKIWWMP